MELLNEMSVRLVLLTQWRSSDERAQTLIEYGLMAALIAIIAVSAVALVGTKIPDLRPAANNLHS